MSETETLRLSLKEYSKLTDLQELYEKFLPFQSRYDDDMNSIHHEMVTNKEIIRRFDEVLTTKASKITVNNLELQLNDYLSLNQYNKGMKLHRAIHDELSSKIDNFEDKISDLNKMAETEIRNA